MPYFDIFTELQFAGCFALIICHEIYPDHCHVICSLVTDTDPNIGTDAHYLIVSLPLSVSCTSLCHPITYTKHTHTPQILLVHLIVQKALLAAWWCSG